MSTQSEEGSADVKQRPPQPETVTALLPRLHVENASAMPTGRRVTGLASRQHPEYGATSQHAPATEYSSTSSTDDHQGEAARLSRVCRGLA
jgi:hypothetical protein